MKNIGASFLDKILATIVRHISAQKYFIIQLDITNACNLKCPHCYQSDHDNSKTIKYDQWLRVLDQYQELLSRLHLAPYILFCGGEPLLSPDLFPLIEECSRRWPKLRMGLITNGTVFNDDNVRFLLSHLRSLNISLDGPNEEMHDKYRGQGNFRKIMESLQKYKGLAERTTLQAILSKRNAKSIEEFFKLGVELKVRAVSFVRFVSEGQGRFLVQDNVDRGLDKFELKEAYEDIVRYSKKYNLNTDTDSPLFCLVSPELGMNGLLGFQGLVVDNEGYLKPSSRASYRLGSLFKNSMSDLFFNHPVLKELRAGNIEQCKGCIHLKKCGGNRNIAYAEYGNFLARDSGCWVDTKN